MRSRRCRKPRRKDCPTKKSNLESKQMSASFTKLPAQQEAIRAKCFHPSGTFVEFPIEDVETSIPARFEKIVRLIRIDWLKIR